MAMNKYLNRSISEQTKEVIKRICLLKPMENEHHTIHLNAGSNLVGRSKATGIRDIRCSKEQLQLIVKPELGRVQLKVLGQNPCSVNGLMVLQNTECELQHGDVLEIVYGRHPFEVVFKPTPEQVRETETINDRKEEGNRAEATHEKWDSIENGNMLVYTSAGAKASEKIAGYDLDGTIIKTKSGNVFPKNIDDWEIIFAEVPAKLKLLEQNGYKICFFTNQAGIAKGKVNLDEFKRKVLLIVKKLGVRAQVFISIGGGYYRKPLPGMWEYLLKEQNNHVSIKLEKCFFVGDAAGRPETSYGGRKRRKDHSMSDRFFAANIGISFYTPEEHFLNSKTEHYNKPEFDPRDIHDQVPLFEPIDTKIPAEKCELIVMVGLPGSGKSFFCKKHIAPLKYTIANADTLGSTQTCLKHCESSLTAGHSCVVDNTNVDAETRKKFIELAARLQVPCRCFTMNVSLAQLRHNIAFRQLTDPKHSKINEMVLNVMKKKYKAPTLDEGFVEIARVNLKPDFCSDEQAKLYKLYLVEK